ncbi:MAG: hypothetical protein OEW05_13150 [Candidatus Aminicenantes bacterium]|nr:hypothetical protein [Candidatus Aminicenantes bacterium]
MNKAVPAFLGLLLLFASCAAPPPRLVPPVEVRAVEGYGSALVEGQEAAVRGRFAFRFGSDGRGRVEAFDPLGRTVYFIDFEATRAWFVLPAKKAYWENEPGEMMNRFLGFVLRPEEVVRLLSGRWDPSAEDGRGPWIVKRDGQGRVAYGERVTLRFEVREFFPGGGVPRLVVVSDLGAAARIKILDLRFNAPGPTSAPERVYLKTFSLVTWTEMTRYLNRDEN